MRANRRQGSGSAHDARGGRPSALQRFAHTVRGTGGQNQRERRAQDRERAVGGMGAGSMLFPSRYVSTAAAAERPSAMAQTIRL